MSASNQNPNCDGSGPHDPGEVRVLPLGSQPNHGNLILCRQCFGRELSFRRERNWSLSKDCKFKLPPWESLEVYPEP
jgi:hypothetical protein